MILAAPSYPSYKEDAFNFAPFNYGLNVLVVSGSDRASRHCWVYTSPPYLFLLRLWFCLGSPHSSTGPYFLRNLTPSTSSWSKNELGMKFWLMRQTSFGGPLGKLPGVTGGRRKQSFWGTLLFLRSDGAVRRADGDNVLTRLSEWKCRKRNWVLGDLELLN